jgi:hypothetical protein
MERAEEEIRVYVVGDVERLACMGRVDFEVHGGQCILYTGRRCVKGGANRLATGTIYYGSIWNPTASG